MSHIMLASYPMSQIMTLTTKLGGESAAVGDYGKKIEMLVDKYKKVAKEITKLGFKGEFLNLEVEVAYPHQIIEDKKFIEEMLENNTMNSTGQLFKLGVHVANAGMATNAGQKQIENNKKKNAAMLEPKTKR